MPKDLPVLQRLRDRGVALRSEIGLFFSLCRVPSSALPAAAARPPPPAWWVRCCGAAPGRCTWAGTSAGRFWRPPSPSPKTRGWCWSCPASSWKCWTAAPASPWSTNVNAQPPGRARHHGRLRRGEKADLPVPEQFGFRGAQRRRPRNAGHDGRSAGPGADLQPAGPGAARRVGGRAGRRGENGRGGRRRGRGLHAGRHPAAGRAQRGKRAGRGRGGPLVRHQPRRHSPGGAGVCGRAPQAGAGGGVAGRAVLQRLHRHQPGPGRGGHPGLRGARGAHRRGIRQKAAL